MLCHVAASLGWPHCPACEVLLIVAALARRHLSKKAHFIETILRLMQCEFPAWTFILNIEKLSQKLRWRSPGTQGSFGEPEKPVNIQGKG
jgi:hypothetical protein